MFDLSGKVSVITGGSSGIGLAVARRFRAAGARVFIACRRDATELANELGATFVRTDVCKEDEGKALMDRVQRDAGHLDVLVNCAGAPASKGGIEQLTSEKLLEAFSVHALATLYCMKHGARLMRPGSAIINVTSLSGVLGVPDYGAYTAAKFAANGLTLCAALELGARGIRVNAICPPSVRTPMLASSVGADVEARLTQTASALDRIIEPEEVAALIHYLAADDCATFSGQLIRLDAGMTAGYSPALLDVLGKGLGHRPS
jgi:3alpha(or 20beta)-hydroxysteroid dehydrogenase